jgi:RNA recognition motif-containing protein
MKIYAGNLAEATTDVDLNTAFSAHGKVERTRIATHKDSGKTKGYGYVEMLDDTEANAAISALNGSQLGGNEIKVNLANARPEEGNGKADKAPELASGR